MSWAKPIGSHEQNTSSVGWAQHINNNNEKGLHLDAIGLFKLSRASRCIYKTTSRWEIDQF